MKRILLVSLAIFLLVSLQAQDFFNESFDHDKRYLILDNPTVSNIKVVRFLTSHGLLDIDTTKIGFVGVYHPDQKYDFSQSAGYIAEKNIKGYYLQEVRGTLNEENLFMENLCTDDFRKIFKNSVGIIFFGGEDIPPSLYGEENWYSSTSDPANSFFIH